MLVGRLRLVWSPGKLPAEYELLRHYEIISVDAEMWPPSSVQEYIVLVTILKVRENSQPRLFPGDCSGGSRDIPLPGGLSLHLWIPGLDVNRSNSPRTS